MAEEIHPAPLVLPFRSFLTHHRNCKIKIKRAVNMIDNVTIKQLYLVGFSLKKFKKNHEMPNGAAGLMNPCIIEIVKIV